MSEKAETTDVVVVDDDTTLLELAVRSLQRAGVSVRGVSDFGSLMEVLEQVTPTVILMDVNMPELFGDEVAAILKGSNRTSSQIFLHSSMDEDELRKMVAEAELDGYIPKSLGTKHMVARVQSLLSG